MKRPAIVIVTFKRQELLAELLDSILGLEPMVPWRVVVVDNENSEKTAQIVAGFAERVDAKWGPAADDPAADGSCERVIYHPMTENTGGSGGFSEGVRVAYELGADWFWVMDDDVSVEPGALSALSAWAERTGAGAIQGQRRDFDGGPFYWQYRFWPRLAIYNPLSRAKWSPGEEFKECNALCFEGGCFSREVVRKIGLPDARFFIYLDDALYGYLASKVTRVLLVPDYVLMRRREVANREVGKHRQLNSTSDMTRFYITRNRGYMARYFRLYGEYSSAGFVLGTWLTFAKELIRLLAVDREHLGSGWKRLVAGQREARRILRDPSWEPMPPLE